MVIGVLSAMMATKVDEGKEDLGIFHRIFLAAAVAIDSFVFSRAFWVPSGR
jgi:hypothetical protein